MSVAAGLAAARARIAAACAQAGREESSVELLLAVKTLPAATIREAITAGGTLLGQNRVQELAATEPDLTDQPHRTHVIGPLQSNKVNQALRWASCVQTVAALPLAERLSRAAERDGIALEVMIQANVSGEETKSGVAPEAAAELAAAVAALPALTVTGFMTIGLNSPDLGAVRAGYERLTDVRDAVVRGGLGSATGLSMGMSGDLEVAIAAGATMVRIGSAVFGARA